MPSLQLPRAAFEPISPDLNLTNLVESTPNFEYGVRIHCDAIDEQGIENFEKLVQLHVVLGGKPLVVEGYQERLEKWIFSLQWLKDNHGNKVENARDITKKTNLPLTIQHYLKNMPGLTNQWNNTNYKDPSRQRIYLKDIDCPTVWHEKLKRLLPPFLFYFNESTGSHKDEAARAGDLMSSLPAEMRAENLMSYIGHEGTYTPSHSEMCSALGHNIMVETSTGSVEDGKLTKPGSSIWFMTETKDRHLVSEYWRSTLGHDIEIEDHFAQVNAWKSAPFKTYIVEQKVGDFILIPPLAAHQVWNRGTRTMKVAWNRTTVETLEMALNESLPKARMVCRDEQYKNKAVVYFTLQKYSALLSASTGRNSKLRGLRKDFKQLFSLYTRILLSESFSRNLPEPRKVEHLPFVGNVTCSYCRCNIFNRFLTCPSCVGKMPDGDDDTYDICMECYAIGRSCACISKLKWVEQFKWKELVQQHESWRNQITQFSHNSNDSAFQPLVMEQERLEKKTLAEVCQGELKRRPWVDISKPTAPEVDPADNIDDDGERNQKRRKVRKSANHNRCHICKAVHPGWKIATCGDCNLGYCYVTLFKAFDLLPISITESITWKCPRCLGICPCGACRRDPTMKPVAPTSTRLGHDTKKIADPRSVESLFDSAHSNLIWLKKFGDHPEDGQDSQRMRQRMEEAAQAKLADPVLDDHDEMDGPESGQPFTTFADQAPLPSSGNPLENVVDGDAPPIDPALMSAPPQDPQVGFVVPKNGVLRENLPSRYEVTEAITFEFPPEERADNQPNTPIGPVIQQTHDVNNILSLGMDGTTNGRGIEIVQSDLGTAPTKSGRGFKRKHILLPDDDFTPDRRVYNRARPTSRNIVTRRRQQRPIYVEGNASDNEGNGTLDAQRPALPQNASAPQPHKSPTNGADQPEASDQASEVSEESLSDEQVSAQRYSSSGSSSTPQEMTQTEKNRHAKLMALKWAEGDIDEFDSDGF